MTVGRLLHPEPFGYNHGFQIRFHPVSFVLASNKNQETRLFWQPYGDFARRLPTIGGYATSEEAEQNSSSKIYPRFSSWPPCRTLYSEVVSTLAWARQP